MLGSSNLAHVTSNRAIEVHIFKALMPFPAKRSSGGGSPLYSRRRSVNEIVFASCSTSYFFWIANASVRDYVGCFALRTV